MYKQMTLLTRKQIVNSNHETNPLQGLTMSAADRKTYSEFVAEGDET